MASIIDLESDARFHAQTRFRPGQKLDPRDPTDAKMIPIWIDIRAKVMREDKAGKLVRTFDNPVVARALADAAVAYQASVAHLDAAAAATDPQVKKQNFAAAATANEIVIKKTSEAAKLQPSVVSPQLAEEAAKAAAAAPPHPSAPAKDQIAHVQATTAHTPMPQGILYKEADARFAAQTHYKPGQKLDPKDPNDARMIPVWNDIFRKVQAEDKAGKLVLTYNHPVVAQNIADAHVADKATAGYLDTAAASSDPSILQKATAAAATAAKVVDQKLSEAAAAQPPTVSPELAHEAAQASDEDAIINRWTDVQFWRQTGYKSGKRLDPKDREDAKMIPVWLRIRDQVRREYLARKAGEKPPTGRDHLAEEQARNAARRAAEARQAARRRPPPRSTVPPDRLGQLRALATRVAQRAAQAARTPFVLVFQHPDGRPDFYTVRSRAELDAEYARRADQHDQYVYVAAFDLTAKDPAAWLVHDSVGVPAAEHAEVPPTAPPTAVPPTEVPPTEAPPTVPPTEKKPPVPFEEGWPVGKTLGVAAVIAGAAALGIALTRKRKVPAPIALPPRARPRARPRPVILATPTPTPMHTTRVR